MGINWHRWQTTDHRPQTDDTLNLSYYLTWLELYHGVTSSFFGIGILLVSDLLGFWYFGRYRSPPFLYRSPLFSSKGGQSSLKRGAIAPLLRKKGGNRPLFDTRTVPDRVFRRYPYGKYREIPTDTDQKIPIRYNSRPDSVLAVVKKRSGQMSMHKHN